MKIALLTDGIYPDYVGGMQKHSAYLAKYLAKNGVDVDLYLRRGDAGGEGGRVDQVTDEERTRIKRFVIPYQDSLYFPGHYLWQSYKYSSAIYEKLRNNLDVDFIYAQGFMGWRLLDEKGKGLRTPPVGVNFHGFNMFQKPSSFRGIFEQRMFRPFVSANIGKADIVFSMGGKLTDIISSLGIHRERICELPNGVEKSWVVPYARPVSQPLRFVFVGRYDRTKGIEELYEVINELSGKIPFVFDFIGPIPGRLRIEAPHIRYKGLIKSGEEMKSIMRDCDVLVCPSHSEGMPTVILEAMASGLAVIATDAGAVSLLVNRENGWLINPGDKIQLKEALKEAMQLPSELLVEKKMRSIEAVSSQFTWDIIADKTISEINRLLRAPND